MVDWNFFKPLAFIVVYLSFAAAVRSILKKLFPAAANWTFLLLLIVGFAVMYYVYYEAFYLLQEMLWPPEWTGSGAENAEDSVGALLQPALLPSRWCFSPPRGRNSPPRKASATISTRPCCWACCSSPAPLPSPTPTRTWKTDGFSPDIEKVLFPFGFGHFG